MNKTAVAALLGAADPVLVGRLMARSAGARTALDADLLPTALVDAVMASDDMVLRRALAGNRIFLRDHRERAVELARTGGDPLTGTALLLNEETDDEIRTAVWQAADPTDPGWRAPGGLVALLVNRDWRRQQPLWHCVGRSPFPEIDAAFLRHVLGGWRLQLAALENLWRHHGRAEVRTVFAQAAQRHPLVAELVDAALAEPETGTDDHLALRRQVEPLREPQWSVRMLRLVEERHGQELADDQRIDWPAVLAEHRRQPFSYSVLAQLVRREECPDEFLVGILDRKLAVPAGRDLLAPLAKHERGVSLAVLAAFVQAPREGGDADARFASVVRASLEQGTVTVDDVLTILTPMSTLCGILHKGDGMLNEAVGARVEGTLGSDPGAWRALWKLLPRWKEPLAPLLAAAVENAGRTAEWVSPKTAPYPSPEQFMAAPKMTVPRTALYALLNACPARIRLDVLPVLDELAQFDLLSRLRFAPEVFDGVLNRGDRPLLRLLAANRHLTDEQRARLLALGDPDVHAQLYFRVSDPRKREIAIGVRRFGTVGDGDPMFADPDPVRLGNVLRFFYFDSKRQWATLSPALESGQVDVAIALLKAIRIPSGLLQLRMLLAVARRDGVPAARELLAADLSDRKYKGAAWEKDAHQAAQTALATTAADGDAVAVGRLADIVVEWSGPERWIARLREVSSQAAAGIEAKLDAERHTVDWALLVREHERSTFPPDVLTYLEKLPGCPPLPQRTDGGWLERWRDHSAALAAGETTLDNILAAAQPARDVLWIGERNGWWQRPDNPLPRLCADLLRTDLDAWQLVVTLLDDFPDTLPELLRTAAAVVTPMPAASG
ncbi:hypothetical protein GCM10022225_15580 [Plantactinospora mayteni]|uniref:Uncharacterized protein n=1 Tax=Plantactinospora mayteni TaxID=566021 RepID=A0ABQ4EHE8_9ACTN|nr:hypothetical protein [Plantactinospora mayteni]GIG93632.1 hypothetical protein Pma05_02050 [Plantactinospora mayteni]